MIDGWRLGRAVGAFHLTQYFGPFPEPVAIDEGEFNEWHFFLPPGWRDYNQASLEEVCAYQWISANRLALEGKQLIPAERWIQLCYEDLFERPTFKMSRKRSNDWISRLMNPCASVAPTFAPPASSRANPTEMEGSQPGSHRAHPADDEADDGAAGL